MSSFDTHAFGRRLEAELHKQRGALALLWRSPDDAPPRAWLQSTLWQRENRELLRASDDPHAGSAAAWVDALRDTFELWRGHYQLAISWRHALPRQHTGDTTSLRQLRGGVLAAREPAARGHYAQLFARYAARAGEPSQRLLQQHFSQRKKAGSFTPLSVAADPDANSAVRCARRLLDRSDDMARQRLPRGWGAGVHAALGAGASEGWPARLTHRWVGEVVAPAGMGAGLQLRAGTLRAPLGALSFAHALGEYGISLLRAARPKSLPLFAHEHPYGLRRHRRRALFASLIAEPAFASRVLGLGRDRRERQLRACAAALLQTLRLDAWRVLVLDAVLAGGEQARERYESVSARLFGEPAPATLLGALPLLHQPVVGAAFVGTLLSALDRDALVDDCEEDWFHNPAAGERLRAEDEAARSESEPTALLQDSAIERIIERLENHLG